MSAPITSRTSLGTLRRLFPEGTVVSAGCAVDWRGPLAGVVLGHSIRFGPAVRVAHFSPLWDGRRSTALPAAAFRWHEGLNYGPGDAVEVYGADDFTPEETR